MSEKKLGRAVRDGRRVTFEFATGIPKQVSGYLYGWDTYHWAVVEFDASGRTTERLIHKSNAAVVTITSSTIEGECEAARTQYEQMVSGFRERLRSDHVVPAHQPTPRST